MLLYMDGRSGQNTVIQHTEAAEDVERLAKKPSVTGQDLLTISVLNS